MRGPRAWFANETTHASGANFVWKSATARLSQNLVDYEVLSPVVHEFDPQTALDNFKSVFRRVLVVETTAAQEKV